MESKVGTPVRAVVVYSAVWLAPPVVPHIFSRYVYGVSASPQVKHFGGGGWGGEPVTRQWNRVFVLGRLPGRQPSPRPTGQPLSRTYIALGYVRPFPCTHALVSSLESLG